MGSHVSLGRHRRNCTICRNPRRDEIEHDFVGWRSPAIIVEEFGLADRSSIYRHAHAFDLLAKRQRNIRAALERIIEQADQVEVTAAVIVAAVQAYSKINAAGQWVERAETTNLNDLFDRMTFDELESYAREGTLPEWFLTATGRDS